MAAKNSIMKFSFFDDIGFNAGMSLKSDRKVKSDIYGSIKTALGEKSENFVIPKQIHSAKIENIDNLQNDDKIVADGLISNKPGNCLTISTADCVPVLFADKSGWYGVIHVGWRGYIGGILENFIGFVNKNNLMAGKIKIHIGPSIDPCCYEIGDDVAVLFDKDHIEISEQKISLNLKKAVADKLINFGVEKENLFVSNECTSCEQDKYYSYRRDGLSPIQMISYIARINK